MVDVHVRSSGSLMPDRNHRLEPQGSRAYQTAAIWGAIFNLPSLADL